ncbi:uncharacterized protein BX663DRAFT_196338 [Cokeromyces recurvatus]|uniref:uncharacterized protein n=1 Tax=Cokeromyces recurvatus TaxID=90255 RepID=UPI0022202AAC|nr:uncharacterized protein BX663DRAFT_196338 [Cokeromyces recurvatus]KAI7906539.1 hypothetical protein BX663DRAFT_196338 [Cokeromyces recurvatus]
MQECVSILQACFLFCTLQIEYFLYSHLTHYFQPFVFNSINLSRYFFSNFMLSISLAFICICLNKVIINF